MMDAKNGLAVNRTFALVLALLAIYHISLLGQGALAWGDEWGSFNRSHLLVQGILEGSSAKIGYALADFGARPGEHLLRFPAALVQVLLEQKTGLPTRNPDSLRVATAQNVLVSLGLSLAFWRASLLVLASPGLAAVSSIAFSLLVSNQIWVRHLIPYDAALLAHLLVLGACFRSAETHTSSVEWKRGVVAAGLLGVSLLAYPLFYYWNRALGLPLAMLCLISGLVLVGALYADWGGPGRGPLVLAGLGSGIALSIYPAYYSFTMACGAFLLLSGREDRRFSITMSSVRKGALFGASAFLVLLVFEALGRLGGISYLGGARLLAGTITQGSFEEGFVFLAKYLVAVDSLGGIAIVALAVVGFWTLVRNRVSVDPRAVRVILVFSALYVVYAFQSVVLHKMAFTGRYARMYIPAFVWLASIGLWSLRGRIREAVAVIWIACGLAGFAIFASEYRKVGYPTDVLYRLGIGYEDLLPQNVRVEFVPIPNFNLPVKAVTAGAQYVTRPNDRRFVIVNFALPLALHPPSGTVMPQGDFSVLSDSLHFISSNWSGWEGYSKEDRVELKKRQFHLRVYRLPD
jgi:hypothetical protein